MHWHPVHGILCVWCIHLLIPAKSFTEWGI